MNALIINSQAISTYNSLYSLNDLHKSSGGADKHKPNNFLRNDQAKELVAEIESENQIAYETVIGKGKKQGTYVCEDLVYAYAMWISAKFNLMVIRAFKAMNTGAIPVLAKTTPADRTPLRQAVSALVGKKGLAYNEAYDMVNQYMGTAHIDEIPADRLGEAIAYVHSLTIHHQVNSNHVAYLINYNSDGAHQNKHIQMELDAIIDEIGSVLAHASQIKQRLDRQTVLHNAARKILYQAYVSV